MDELQAGVQRSLACLRLTLAMKTLGRTDLSHR